jgi:DNA end-binding protein Ku
MAARAISGASISFGLVTIPVRVYAATDSSADVSFHLLHAKDGVRLRQQLYCPKDGDIVPRSEAVKGYEFEKERYVTLTPEELKGLEERVTQGIEVVEFVPLASIDPRYYERSYYLGPGRGADRPFALFVRALEEIELAAIAQYATRGRGYLVALRARDRRIVMQQLFHADEIRPLDEVPAPDAEARPAELKLARELIERLQVEAFDPGRFRDPVRERTRALIARKLEGELDLTAPAPQEPRGKVVDLMSALKASLERGGRARHDRRAARQVARTSTRARRGARAARRRAS